MRFILTALIATLLAGCASTPERVLSSVDIKEIKPRYIKDEQFRRISEYLTNKEHMGNRIILRSQTRERSGYYFVLILDEKIRRLPNGTQIIGEFYTPRSLEKQTYTFVLPAIRPKTNEIFIGLTGEDWPQRDEVPSAWKFTIKDANGALLAEKKSYLWSL
mgnify:CR=1 FL=1